MVNNSRSRPLVLAHRGACLVEPENTLAAFRAAITQGADGVELDIHRSADGELVVHHDADARDVGLLLHAEFRDIRRVRPDIPTLTECFEALGAALVNVEIKCCSWDPDPDPDHLVARAVVELVTALGVRDQVVVSSFDLTHLDAIREHDADLETGLLMHGHDPTTFIAVCVERGHQWLHPDWGNLARHLEACVETAHVAGIRIDPWTIDDPETIERFAAAGVDALITNDPATALATLG